MFASKSHRKETISKSLRKEITKKDKELKYVQPTAYICTYNTLKSTPALL